MKKGISFQNHLFIAFSIVSLAFAVFYYQRNITLQNKILETSFVRNNKLIFKTVKLGLEIGLKSDNFSAIRDVFEYAKGQNDLSWIIIRDGNKDVFANYPVDLNLEKAKKEALQKEFSPSTSSYYTEEGTYNTPLTSGELAISFNTNSYENIKREIKRESFIMTSGILVVALFISFMISKLLMTSLSNLQKTIEKISNGNFYEKIFTKSQTKEVISLSSSFNFMMDQVNYERERSEELLLNILPAKVAARLKDKETTIAVSNPSASILFADLVGYTSFSKNKSPEDVVSLLNTIFTRFDEKTSELGLEKIKTIGDSYMVAGGLFCPEDEAPSVLKLAESLEAILIQINKENSTNFQVRIGIHTGPVVAGVIGKIKFSFDLWGNTVNMASRLESKGTPSKIHISKEFKNSLEQKGINTSSFINNQFHAKGIGKLDSFYTS